MKPTAVALHAKTRDRVKILDAVRAALAAEGLEWAGEAADASPEAVRLLLMPANRTWTTLYLERFDLAPGLAGRLALQVQAPVLVTGHYEEMAFFYLAYAPDGDEVDAYHSCPDYAKEIGEDDASDAELEATRGDPQALAALVGGKAEALGEVLSSARIERLRDHGSSDEAADPRQALERLAALMGLPDLLEGFDEHWGLDEEDEDGQGVRYLAYAPPADPTRFERLYGRLRDRFRRPAAAAVPNEAGEDEDEA